MVSHDPLQDAQLAQLWRGKVLPVRLMRARPWLVQRVGTLLLAFFLVGVSMLLLIPIIDQWGEEGVFVGVIVAGVFGLFGVLMLWAACHQALASWVAETIVEIERSELRPGDKVQLCIRQPGPVELRSLRASVVCMERPWHSSGQRRGSRPPSRMVYQQHVLDLSDTSVSTGETLERIVLLEIPPDARLCSDESATIEWTIEVWGRVQHWPGFMHQFKFTVDME